MLLAWKHHSGYKAPITTYRSLHCNGNNLTCSEAQLRWFWQSLQDSAPQDTYSCLVCWYRCCPAVGSRLSFPDTHRCLKETMAEGYVCLFSDWIFKVLSTDTEWRLCFTDTISVWEKQRQTAKFSWHSSMSGRNNARWLLLVCNWILMSCQQHRLKGTFSLTPIKGVWKGQWQIPILHSNCISRLCQLHRVKATFSWH